jgi:hypothetical protein
VLMTGASKLVQLRGARPAAWCEACHNRRYSQRTMCRLGAAVVLRSACTPAAVTLMQQVRLRLIEELRSQKHTN